MAKVIAFDVEARQGLRRGIDTVAKAVRITVGPKGRKVVLEKKYGGPTVTNDGVTIVREIELKDPQESMDPVGGDGSITRTASRPSSPCVREGPFVRQRSSGCSWRPVRRPKTHVKYQRNRAFRLSLWRAAVATYPGLPPRPCTDAAGEGRGAIDSVPRRQRSSGTRASTGLCWSKADRSPSPLQV
jgi:hypothetical protein